MCTYILYIPVREIHTSAHLDPYVIARIRVSNSQIKRPESPFGYSQDFELLPSSLSRYSSTYRRSRETERGELLNF